MVRTRHQQTEDPNPPSPPPDLPPRRRTRKGGVKKRKNVEPTTTDESVKDKNSQQFQGDARPPTAKHIPPPRLATPDRMTIIQFRDWKQRWNDFASTQQILQYPIEAQHGILHKPDSPIVEVLKLMEAYIRQKRNPLLDRQEFHRRDQNAGESVDRYYAALRVLDDACSHEGELQCAKCSITPELVDADIRIRDRFICGLRDKEMQRRVLAEQYGSVLTMDKVLSLCTAVESSYSAGVSLGQHGHREVEVNNAQSAYKNKSKSVTFNHAPSNREKCKWCGAGRHRYENCPARNARCSHCKRIGHYETVCFQKLRAANQAIEIPAYNSNQTGATMGNVTIFRAGKSNNLLQIPTQIVEDMHNIMWLPDTGADVDAISIQDIQSLGDKAKAQLTPDKQEVYAANGSSLGPVGSISAVLNKAGCIASDFHPDWPCSELKENCIDIETQGIINIISSGVKQYPIEIPPNSKTDEIQQEILKQLAEAFDDSVLKPMIGAPMKIDLVPDAKPCRRYKAYTIHSTGTSYPVKVPREAVARIPPGNKYFTTLDARHGYWQVPLDESSKKLTTFITPWGCFRYCRNVMGLISAGDEHNRRGDEAIKGISNVEKIVEDILIYDDDLETHTKRVMEVIQRCLDHGMTLNAKKFKFGKPDVEWCGYRVNQDGYTPSPHLVQALQQFPVPLPKRQLALPIRALLPKNAAFIWEPLHQKAFQEIIQEFSSPRILAQFDPSRPVRLETDGAQSKGLGFALWQEQSDNSWKLLQAGSRFVTPTEARYSATEIELLAVTWAVKKCRMFLLGKPFELVVDHRPLVSILNAKTLDEIENPRLQRLKEKLACFRPQVVWRAGKQHIVVDVFSRYPSSTPTAEEEEDFDVPTNFAAILKDPEDGTDILQDPILVAVKDAGGICSEYGRLIQLIRIGFPEHKQNLDRDLAPYWKIKDELRVEEGIIMWGRRILIPEALRRNVLETLHASHQGQERTLRRARQAVFWPNISNDVKNLVRGCNECASRLPSHQKEPMLVEQSCSRPFQCVGVDLFKYAGFEYLVMVDKFSGWLSVAKCGHSTNTSRVIHLLKQMMINVGIPEKLISDNGPQFSSFEFKNWVQKWGIVHDPSSPHYPQANGLAESGVKAASHLIAKTSPNGDLTTDAFQLGLMELRNTPRADGRSPAELVFGFPIRTKLPLHRAQFAKEWRKQMAEADTRASRLKEKALSHYNTTARPLPHLKRGEIVRVQDPVTKEWTRIGEVIDAHHRGRSYTIRTESGRVFWRNRKFLRRYYSGQYAETEEEPAGRSEPRRSTRLRRVPERFTARVQLDRRSNSKGGHEGRYPTLPHTSENGHRGQLKTPHMVCPAAASRM
ncbi:Transposon Tf2-6 polyprotein [Orchesella cincta]|uniref:RNA-directed DNA polymerase n=1 Tax=Orchesella cincta TaxID=48709 RepID=A0A1D2N407_ORCCI|nr:Transposon Tf2-6 polyprotein [Orchesella cincta]